MRIISGTAKGTKLYSLEGKTTRPTLDRVKEALFNIIQNEIKGSIFLDLFSGSGAIGLEAASRGAKKVILCDANKNAVNIIKKNIEKTHQEKSTILYQKDFKEVLETKINEKLDLIYIDPPYQSNYAIKAIEILVTKELLNQNSQVIIETDRREEIEEEIKKNEKIKGKIDIIDTRKYGRATLIFLKLV